MMLGLIVTIIFSLEVAYFAIQNSSGVPIRFVNYQFTGIPIYIVVVTSILAGVLMAWFISALNSASYFMKLRSKDSTINKDRKDILEMKSKIRNLEIENEKLRNQKRVIVKEEKSIDRKTNPNIFGRISPRTT